VISGTPTVVVAATNYTVTATNTGGAAPVTLSIRVNAVAPSALTYSTNPATYTNGTAITNNTPTSGGGAVVSYAVSPPLPAGLSLNTTTGVISGTPTVVVAATNYTVTATNTGGSTTASVSITVASAVSTLSGSAAENVTLTLTAPSGYYFSSVAYASYGNGTSTVQGTCHASNSSTLVAGVFVGQTTGSIVANNITFGDPCSGTAKTLHVTLNYLPL
jgi:hypothetical protein